MTRPKATTRSGPPRAAALLRGRPAAAVRCASGEPLHKPAKGPPVGSLPGGRHGLTLVEVAAAIALAVVLLAMVVEAGRAHSRQARLAREKLRAIEAIERLIGEWRRTGFTPPAPAGGPLAGYEPWRWSTAVRQPPAPGTPGIRLVEVSITRGSDPSPIAAVEVLAADPPRSPRTRERAEPSAPNRTTPGDTADPEPR